MGQVINCKINTAKIPRHLFFKGEKGVYLDFTIAERREPTQYGQTHTIYAYDKERGEKVYFGDGTIKDFGESKPITESDLPPGVDGIENAHVIEGGNHPDDDLPF